MQPTLELAIRAAWIAIGLVWAVTAIAAKRIVRAEPAGSRTGHVLTMALALALVFSPAVRFGPLAWRAVPDSAAAEEIGFALTVAGIAFAIHARLYLGGNWSSIAAIKQGHTLVRTGPYAVVRHPIYAGLLLGLAGTAIAYGEIGCFLGAILAFAAWLAKARTEESLLAGQFGDTYRQYRRQVKTLIPFVL